jgi:hypothetical protein
MSAADKIKLDNLQNIEANINWNNITNKPNSFTPSNHTHQKSDITDFNHSHGDIDENGVISNGNSGDILILGVGNRITSSASINANKVQDSPAYESIGVNQNSNQSVINKAINDTLQWCQDYLDDLEDEIHDLNTNSIALNNTNELSNLYAIDNVTTQSDLNIKFADLIRNSGGSGNSNNNVDWSNIINKPSFGTGANDFATGNHTHYSSAITTVSWGTGLTPQQRNIISSALNIANGDSLDTVLKESFWNIVNTLQNKANSTHIHTVLDVTDLSEHIPSKTSDLTNDGANGTNVFVSDNDSRLSDARTPTAHTHNVLDINDFPTIPSKTSDLTNDSGFLTSHQSLKTINNESIVGTGNITITGGSNITVDSTLSSISENPVQNQAIYSALENKANNTVATSSANGLMSTTDKNKLDGMSTVSFTINYTDGTSETINIYKQNSS